jgi:hypothetical protein
MAPLTVEQTDALLAGATDGVAERLAVLGAAERAVTRRSFIDELAETLGHDWKLGAERNALQDREADLLSLTGPLYGPNIALRAQPVSDADEDARLVALVEAGWAVGRSNFSHLLLDVFNILTAYERPDFVAGYLVAAAPSGRWKNRTRAKTGSHHRSVRSGRSACSPTSPREDLGGALLARKSTAACGRFRNTSSSPQ